MLHKMTIEEFLENLASPNPTPGGGSAAAFIGALSAALTCMTARLTLKKSQDDALKAEMESISKRSETLMRKLTDGVDADAGSYDDVLQAYRLPKGTEEEIAAREERIQAALKHAVEVPMNTVRWSAEAMTLARTAAAKGRSSAKTDALVGAAAAQAAIHGGLLNIETNLKSIQDAAFAQVILNELKELMKSIAQPDVAGHAD